MHMDPLQGTFAIGFGIYIGYVVEKAGSIRPSMVCHAFNNSVQVILGRYAAGGGEEMPTQEAAIVALIAAVVVALCSLYIYFRVSPPAKAPHSGFPVLAPSMEMPRSIG